MHPNVEAAMVVGLQGYCFEDGDVERFKGFLAKLSSPKEK